MNQEQQRIAIAEWMGYVWYRAPKDRHFPDKKYRFLALPQIQEYEGQIDIWKLRADGTERIIDSEAWKKAQGVDYVPDYPNDLNTIHEAEKKLLASEHTDMLGHNYLQILWEVCEDIYFKQITTCMATAAQRSEALCRTLWPERFE